MTAARTDHKRFRPTNARQGLKKLPLHAVLLDQRVELYMNFPNISDPSFYSHLSAKQECFAGAHIRAVCASLGCSVSKPEPDDDKLDFTISCRVRGAVFSKPKIDIQSKCHLVDFHLKPKITSFSYTIDKSLFDNHRDERVTTPRLLVVTLVPRECSSWIKYGHRATSLSFCSYWFSLAGFPSLPAGQETKTLRIPKRNVFSATFLHDAMQKIADGKPPFRPVGNRHA